MQQQSHVQRNAALALLPLLRRQCTLLIPNCYRLQWMLMPGDGRVTQAVNAHVKVGACGAVISLSLQYLTSAYRTLLDKFGRVAVMQVPQHHHGCVFGTTK